ncbi:MAG TPA: hypothetical protein VKA30_11665, partial [Actinomycetota bacterium]|nr:hypothetical protein [Actinomycetota bacterium]
MEQDEGPYHLEGAPFRADLIEDRTGVPLQLTVALRWADSTPVVGATVDVWHCDALGRYSGFSAPGPADSNAVPPDESVEHFLRGRQLTDHDGRCEFRTIYPGWYGGRTVHIHLIADLGDDRLTSQLFFPESMSDDVLSHPPYAARPDRDTRNASDEIFAHRGNETVLTVAAAGDGYRASICLELARRGVAKT